MPLAALPWLPACHARQVDAAFALAILLSKGILARVGPLLTVVVLKGVLPCVASRWRLLGWHWRLLLLVVKIRRVGPAESSTLSGRLPCLLLEGQALAGWGAGRQRCWGCLAPGAGWCWRRWRRQRPTRRWRRQRTAACSVQLAPRCGRSPAPLIDTLQLLGAVQGLGARALERERRRAGWINLAQTQRDDQLVQKSYKDATACRRRAWGGPHADHSVHARCGPGGIASVLHTAGRLTRQTGQQRRPTVKRLSPSRAVPAPGQRARPPAML